MNDAVGIGKKVARLASVVAERGVLDEVEETAFNKVLRLFRDSSTEVQREARRALAPADSRGLWRIAEIYVDLALSQHCCDRVLDALTVFALEDFRSDPRENHLRMLLLRWADLRIGCGLAWSSYAGMFSERAALRLDDFLRMPAASLTLASAGLRVSEVDGRIDFLPFEAVRNRRSE